METIVIEKLGRMVLLNEAKIFFTMAQHNGKER
jgi:hypothetical protein